MSREATLGEILDHVHDDSGHVLNVLDLPDTTRLLPQPSYVT